MIKSFTAFTNEIDDIDAAVAEILAQLDLEGENKLLAHSIGIVSCFAEYVESGVYAALCQKLPFDVVGTTTIANMTSGEIGETMLALMVLTSDEVNFATAVSVPITGEDEAPLKALYEEATGKLDGKPALMLSYVPLLTTLGSDFYVDCMTRISGNVPNFGTLAVDHNTDYHDSRVLLNGEAWPDRFVLVLVEGPVDPLFYVGAVSNEKIFSEKGAVSASEGNQLQMVNGVTTLEYLVSLGLTKNEEGSITGINSFPIIVDYNDGTEPVARAMFAMTPEGYAICGGNIPVGATLSLGSFDSVEITETSYRTLQKALASGERKTLLIYSCVGRYFSQGYDTTAEFDRLIEALEQSGATYLAAYSGGELCPVCTREDGTINRNHNNTFIVCAL